MRVHNFALGVSDIKKIIVMKKKQVLNLNRKKFHVNV